ncbi:MAG: hypothetical protein GY928_04790 [Colwellia sp.]|nr:hypothetical protein [Colwellia sp.]
MKKQQGVHRIYCFMFVILIVGVVATTSGCRKPADDDDVFRLNYIKFLARDILPQYLTQIYEDSEHGNFDGYSINERIELNKMKNKNTCLLKFCLFSFGRFDTYLEDTGFGAHLMVKKNGIDIIKKLIKDGNLLKQEKVKTTIHYYKRSTGQVASTLDKNSFETSVVLPSSFDRAIFSNSHNKEKSSYSQIVRETNSILFAYDLKNAECSGCHGIEQLNRLSSLEQINFIRKYKLVIPDDNNSYSSVVFWGKIK